MFAQKEGREGACVLFPLGEIELLLFLPQLRRLLLPLLLPVWRDGRARVCTYTPHESAFMNPLTGGEQNEKKGRRRPSRLFFKRERSQRDVSRN